MSELYERLFDLRAQQANATADKRQSYETEIASILEQINRSTS